MIKYKKMNKNELNKELVNACLSGKFKIVKYLLTSPEFKEQTDIDCKGIEGAEWGLIMLASINNHIEIMKYLLTNKALKKTANIHQKNNLGNNILMHNCGSGNLDKLKMSYYNRSNKINANSSLNIISILDKLETNKVIKEFNSKLEDKNLNNPLRKASLVITLQEHNLLKEISKSIYKDKNYIKLNNAKNNISNDYIHKLSKTIVDNLVAKDIKLLIIGKNTGWKNGINLGSKNNRRGLNLPHSKLVELLKYKCLLNNILLVEQEESYTSKTSFESNEVMPIYSKSKKLDINNNVNTQELSTVLKTNILPQGKNSQAIRIGQKLYKKAINNKNHLVCHADVNGAMNIIRKFINGFNIINLKQALKQNNLVNSLQKLYEYRIVKLLNYKINSQALA